MMQTTRRSPILIFFTGVFGGICISVLIGIGLFYSRTVQMAPPTPISAISPTLGVPFRTSTPTLTPEDPLEQAELALSLGHPEEVQDFLYPMIKHWTSNDDLIRGYRLLGDAELAQGHPQLAVPYFEKLYFHEPTAENLFLLATIYDAGGDNWNALAKYQELANWENLPPEVDLEFVNMRVYDISRALGTPLPTLTLLP